MVLDFVEVLMKRYISKGAFDVKFGGNVGWGVGAGVGSVLGAGVGRGIVDKVYSSVGDEDGEGFE